MNRDEDLPTPSDGSQTNPCAMFLYHLGTRTGRLSCTSPNLSNVPQSDTKVLEPADEEYLRGISA